MRRRLSLRIRCRLTDLAHTSRCADPLGWRNGSVGKTAPKRLRGRRDTFETSPEEIFNNGGVRDMCGGLTTDCGWRVGVAARADSSLWIC